MSFNVINMKHRAAGDQWIHINDVDGKPMYHDQEPVRIKFKSLHGEAFRKAFFKMNVKLSQLKTKKEEDIKSRGKDEINQDVALDELTEAFLQAESTAIDMITEMAVDWVGFYDETGSALKFDAEILRFIISQPENYHVLTQIKQAFKSHEGFMSA